MRDFIGFLIYLGVFLGPVILFLAVAFASMGCATQVTVGPGCLIDATVQTGTVVRCVEIERRSISDTVEAAAPLAGALAVP